MTTKKLDPVHPEEILQKEFLEPMGLSQNRLALALGVPARRINEIVLGKRGITADTALRLARYFKMSPQFWLGLQMNYRCLAPNLLRGCGLRGHPNSVSGIPGYRTIRHST